MPCIFAEELHELEHALVVELAFFFLPGGNGHEDCAVVLFLVKVVAFVVCWVGNVIQVKQ